MLMLPQSGCSCPVISLNKVDLPAPLGPITPTIPPGGKVKAEHILLSDPDGAVELWLNDDVRPTGNLVPDAHIVALMLSHGIRTIWTRDRDYRSFSGIRVRDPF